MMSLAGGLVIKLLIIYYSSRFTITLRLNYHSAAPLEGGVYRHFFNHTKSNIHLQTSFHSFLPVERNLSWILYSDRFSIFVDVEAEGRRISHKREFLPLACVESRGCKPFEDVLL